MAGSEVPEPNDARGVDSTLFRQIMGRFATGVTILTVNHEGEMRGITVNSLTSISLDPPLVLVSIDKRARTHYLLEHASHFAISILSIEQKDWSDRFAGRLGDLHAQFADIPHRLSPSGAPYIDGSLAVMHCRTTAIYPGGDHSIFLAIMEEASQGIDAPPLLFFRGRYTQPL
jgi:flavin reductase